MSLSISQKVGLVDLQVAFSAAAAASKVSVTQGKAGTNQPRLTVGNRTLSNAGAICRFFAHGTGLLPSSLLEQAKMDEVMDLTSSTIMAMVEAGGPLDKVVGRLPTPHSGFFAGAAASLADIAVFAALYPAGDADASSLGPLEQWFKTMKSQDWVSATLKNLKVSKGSDVKVAKPMKGSAKVTAPAPATTNQSTKSSKPKRSRGAKDPAWGPRVPIGHTGFSWGRDKQKASASTTTTTPTRTCNNPSCRCSGCTCGTGCSCNVSPANVCDPCKVSSEKASKPKLPVAGKRNILITSALPYVNNVPHLGNIIGCVLSADVYARFCRLRDHNAIYICGTDEYGTATETKALEAGLTPQQICNHYHAIHKEIYDWFDIKFDNFGRTTTKHQTMIAQDIFNRIEKNDRIIAQDVTQLWCEKLGFLADRFVEGTCPKCKYEDARGDQCDACGSLLNAIELINPRAKLDPNAVITTKTSRHLFLDLPTLTPDLEKFVKEASVTGQWSQNSITTTNGWLRDGLKPRCITRDLKWGTPVPAKGFEDKVFYVWFDAPIGYISITAEYTDEWEKWWKNPKDVELVQFMGKDNIPFHTVIFPSSLIAADDNYTMLHHINTTEYLNYETGKFSKSRGVGVFGDDAKKTGVPSEVWRYYLLSNRPEASDSVFMWADFAAKLNCELVANLGNLVNRVMTFTTKQFAGVVPDYSTLLPEDEAFIQAIKDQRVQYIELLEAYKIKDGLRSTMILSKVGNAYMQANAPWVLAKSDRARCGTVLALLINMCYHLAVMMEPYMPAFTANLCKQIGMAVLSDALAGDFKMQVPGGHQMGPPTVLFQKISDEKKWVEEMRSRFAGKQEGVKEVFPLHLVVGKVVEVTDHPDADSLYVMKVDLNEPKGPRTICSGLKAHYTQEQLMGSSVVVLANGKTSKLKGVRSQGMILTGVDGDTIKLMTSNKPAGTQVAPEGCDVKIVKNYNIRKEFSKLKLKTQEGSGDGAFSGMALLADGEAITCSIKSGADIK